MAKPRKLPSGSWNIQVFDYKDENGKNHYKSFTEPTKYLCQYKANEFLLKKKEKEEKEKRKIKTLGEAIDEYIEENKLHSPSTSQGYEEIRKWSFPDLMEMNVQDITYEVFQDAIYKETQRPSQKGKPYAPKTIKNRASLVKSVIRKETGRDYVVKLPQPKPQFIELPEPEDVINAIKGTDVELECMLAIWLSFSMSEIKGLKASSIRNGCIYIDQVLIDVHNKEVIKENAKVDTRNRKHKIPPYIMKLIKKNEAYIRYTETGKDGLLFPKPGRMIYRHFVAAMKKADIKLTFHQLRHVNASVMLKLKIPTKYAQERGGWKTDSTLKKVYQHTFSSERIAVDKQVDDYFAQLV